MLWQTARQQSGETYRDEGEGFPCVPMGGISSEGLREAARSKAL